MRNYQDLTLQQTCPSCDSGNVITLLERYEISSRLHKDFSDDSYQSFLETFSILLEQDLESIRTAINTFDVECPAFTRLKKIEYGCNFARIQTGTRHVLNLAWLGAIADYSGRNILVFCDLLCLNFLHQGENIVLFRPNRNSDNEIPLACVLSGLNIYHPVADSPILLNFCNDLNITNLEYVESIFGDNDERLNLNEREISSREIVLLEAIDDTFTLIDTTQTENDESTSSNVRGDPIPTNSKTIQQFLDINYSNSNVMDIEIANYTNTDKLRILESQQEHLEYQRAFDIDGLFGHFPMETMAKVLKCPAKILVTPSIVDKRTSKSVLKIMQPDSDNEKTLLSVKVGSIEFPLGIIDLLVVLNSLRKISDKQLSALFKECAEYARTLPCEYDIDHFTECQSKGTRDSHRSTARASTVNHRKNESEPYTRTLAICYFHHFKKLLDSKLLLMNIQSSVDIFFKCIGSKSTTFSENIGHCLESLNYFSSALDFKAIDERTAWIDYCITTSASSSGDEPVKN